MSGLLENLKLMYAHDAIVLAGIENGSVRGIPLTQGKIAIIDAEDYERIAKYRWHIQVKGNTIYARRYEGKRMLLLHREILGLIYGDGKLTDHKNRNGLDNRKANLRIATKSLNAYNCKMQRHNKSGYRGVHWLNKERRWKAEIKILGRKVSCGYFTDPIQAALAYDRMAVKYRGDTAVLNFPERI